MGLGKCENITKYSTLKLSDRRIDCFSNHLLTSYQSNWF